MPGATAPFKGFDPLNLATLGSDSTFAWFRASELKHSRVAMLATTGYLVQAAGIHFPGMLSSDVSFASLSTMKPLDAWSAVPDAGMFMFCMYMIIQFRQHEKILILDILHVGKAQIVGMIFLAEIISESANTHYTKGGPLPTMIFPPIDFSGVDATTLATKQSRELNNGRLAMIAIMSFCAEANIEGAVPALAGNPMF